MCRFVATLTAVLALIHALEARDLLQVVDATWPPEWDLYKAYFNARLETWDKLSGSASRQCGTLGAKPCPGKTTCGMGGPAGGPTAQLVVNKLGRCQMPGNECGLQGEPPCDSNAGWLQNIGMFSDVMHVNWAFDLGADGCVVSAFYHSMRFVLDKASGLCVPCGSPGEPACAVNDHDPAPPCASNIRTAPGTASIVSGTMCKAVASTCGTLGGKAESSPACPVGSTPFPDANKDGCEDHLMKSGTTCVPCKAETSTEFQTLLGGHTCHPTNPAYADCGDNEQLPCPVAPGRGFGCLGGTHQAIVNFTNSQDIKTPLCEYAACGTPGAKYPLCGPLSEATKDDFFQKIEPEYDPRGTGCYPGYNSRDGACWPCGVTYENLAGGGTDKPLPAFATNKDAFQQQTGYPSYWDGILETKLWRTRCDYIGCGLQAWQQLRNDPYNATLGRSQPFMLNPDLSICVADPGWLNQTALPFYLHDYFNNVDLGINWAVGLVGAPPLPGNDSVGTNGAPPNFGSTYNLNNNAAGSSSLASMLLALVFGALTLCLLA